MAAGLRYEGSAAFALLQSGGHGLAKVVRAEAFGLGLDRDGSDPWTIGQP
ncbi:MAG: hypothetical protein GY946_12710 [bacterium]|nr:hypothetical protein [bacterium]